MPSVACSVESMRPSPPSATITSAASIGALAVRARPAGRSAAWASSTGLATKWIRSKRQGRRRSAAAGAATLARAPAELLHRPVVVFAAARGPRLDVELDRDLAGLLEDQRRVELLALGQGRFQPHEHHVRAAGLQRDRRARRDVQRRHRRHARDAVRREGVGCVPAHLGEVRRTSISRSGSVPALVMLR